MPLASTLWPISGFSVVVILLPLWSQSVAVGLGSAGGDQRRWRSGGIAEDEVGDAAGLGLALDLVGQPVAPLSALPAVAFQLRDLGDLDVHAAAAADPHRG